MKTSTFNAIGFIKGAEQVGFTREQAEYQANQLNDLVNNELVTKSFLANELEKLELKIIVKVGGMMVIQSGVILSVISFMLKHT